MYYIYKLKTDIKTLFLEEDESVWLCIKAVGALSCHIKGNAGHHVIFYMAAIYTLNNENVFVYTKNLAGDIFCEIFSIFVLLKKRNQSYTLVWLILVLFLLFGVISLAISILAKFKFVGIIALVLFCMSRNNRCNGVIILKFRLATNPKTVPIPSKEIQIQFLLVRLIPNN